jgi:prepilin-type N-terminal cleavage/methylation domain-containing protein
MKNKKGFTLVELMIVVVILGILAAIAIPLYMKFVQQSKAGEARLNMGKIGTLVEAFYNGRAEKNSDATITPGTLAALVVAYPRCETDDIDCTGACGADDGDGSDESVPAAILDIKGRKYQATSTDWNPSTTGTAVTAWARIPFAITQPIQYQYCYQAQGTAAESWFTTKAYGDVDGDGITSVYSRFGTVLNGAPTIGPIASIRDDE